MCKKKETRRRQRLLFSGKFDMDTLNKLYKNHSPEVKNWYSAFR
jgi:hypothetical protein